MDRSREARFCPSAKRDRHPATFECPRSCEQPPVDVRRPRDVAEPHEVLERRPDISDLREPVSGNGKGPLVAVALAVYVKMWSRYLFVVRIAMRSAAEVE